MDTLLLQLQRHWQTVLDDPNATPGNRRHAEWKRDPDGPDFSSTLYLIEQLVSREVVEKGVRAKG